MDYILCFCCVFISCLAMAQSVDGTWEGTLTLERPTPRKEYKFQLILKKEGKHIQGTSYIFFEEEPVAMDLSGRYFHDRSMRLFNHQVLYPTEDPNREKFIRKYQLMYKRSAFSEDTIEGYWQEKNDPIFAKYRKGRIYLKRIRKDSKA